MFRLDGALVPNGSARAHLLTHLRPVCELDPQKKPYALDIFGSVQTKSGQPGHHGRNHPSPCTHCSYLTLIRNSTSDCIHTFSKQACSRPTIPWKEWAEGPLTAGSSKDKRKKDLPLALCPSLSLVHSSISLLGLRSTRCFVLAVSRAIRKQASKQAACMAVIYVCTLFYVAVSRAFMSRARGWYIVPNCLCS